MTSANANVRPSLVIRTATSTSTPTTGRWNEVLSCTVVIGTNPPLAAATATTVAVSAAAISACPDRPPPSRASRSDHGSRRVAPPSPTSSTVRPSSSTQGATLSRRIFSPSAGFTVTPP